MIFKSSVNIPGSREVLEKLKKSDGVIIFGTGNFGSIVLAGLKIAGIKVLGYGDNNEKHWHTKWNDINIFSVDDLKEKFQNTPVIIASLSYAYIKKQLENININQIYDCDFLFSNIHLDLEKCSTHWSAKRCKEHIETYMFAMQSENSKKNQILNVKHLDLVLTEKCSLKCKDCSNLMQYYEKPVDEDFDILVKSLDKFMSSVDSVNEIRLIGGEPLLYKRICDVMEKVLTYKNFKKIYVYTNGTIVFKNNKMSVFQNEKVLFRISDYGKISRNVKPLEQELERLNINYLTERITTWQNCAKIQLYDRPDSLTKFIYGNCCVNQFLTLLHGKLYLCPFQAHAENLGAVPNIKKDSINLINENIETIRKRIYELYFETEYLEACKYCNGRDPNVENVEAALQAEQPLEYTKINSSY
jgi:MoaA/NifB/PqqE/SkfB family radical SAM enzyme